MSSAFMSSTEESTRKNLGDTVDLGLPAPELELDELSLVHPVRFGGGSIFELLRSVLGGGNKG